MEEDLLTDGAARIADFVSRFSPARRSLVLRTFDRVGEIPAEELPKAVSKLNQFIDRGSSLTDNDQVDLPYTREQVNAVVDASITLQSFIQAGESVEDTAQAFRLALSLKPSAEAAVNRLLSIFEERKADIVAREERKALSKATLPHLDDTDFSIDVRLKFKDGHVSKSVPVVIAYIDTDATDQQLWFQMTKEDVEKLRRDLERISAELDAATTWSSKD